MNPIIESPAWGCTVINPETPTFRHYHRPPYSWRGLWGPRGYLVAEAGDGNYWLQGVYFEPRDLKQNPPRKVSGDGLAAFVAGQRLTLAEPLAARQLPRFYWPELTMAASSAYYLNIFSLRFEREVLAPLKEHWRAGTITTSQYMTALEAL